MTKSWDVIVVGGGLAGLAAGAAAARRGARAVVIEANSLGGRARTTQRGDYTFNLGAHALYVGGPGMAALRSLGVDPRGAPPPLDRYRMLRDGRQHLMPVSPSTLARTTVVGIRAKAKLATLLARLPRLDAEAAAPLSINDWLADHDVTGAAGDVVRALVRLSSYTSDFDDTSADVAIHQLQIASRAGVRYLHGGWSPLVAALADAVEVRRGRASAVEGDGHSVEVTVDGERLRARAAVVATGTPAAARALLPDAPAWGDLAPPVTAACLDVGVGRIPSPGWVVGVDDPVYATTQSPPARQAPPGHAVVSVLRYGARSKEADRAEAERFLREAGVAPGDVVVDRFLARMVVVGTQPRPSLGGLRGRPRVDATGARNVFLAGDWVGPDGYLADASLASALKAAERAVRNLERSATIVA